MAVLLAHVRVSVLRSVVTLAVRSTMTMCGRWFVTNAISSDAAVDRASMLILAMYSMAVRVLTMQLARRSGSRAGRDTTQSIMATFVSEMLLVVAMMILKRSFGGDVGAIAGLVL